MVFASMRDEEKKMSVISKLAVGAVVLVALSGCYYYGDRYGPDRGYYGPGPGPGPYYDDGYYDGYYGNYYGGYWGGDGVFYYYDADHHYHADTSHHFRHEQFEGARQVHADHDAQHTDGGRGDHDHDH
jgi:hypothetical protein